MAVTIDSISHGRFGINIISGWQRREYTQMGIWPGSGIRRDLCAAKMSGHARHGSKRESIRSEKRSTLMNSGCHPTAHSSRMICAGAKRWLGTGQIPICVYSRRCQPEMMVDPEPAVRNRIDRHRHAAAIAAAW